MAGFYPEWEDTNDSAANTTNNGFYPVMVDVNEMEEEVDATPSLFFPPTVLEDVPQQAEI